MVSMKVRLAAPGEDMVVVDEPVSPTGQYFNSSVLSVNVLAAFETDVPIDDSPTFYTLENQFLPVNPRFSSIMVKDEHGVQQWKKVEVKLQDHVNVPVFPPGLDLYDDHLKEYMSRIAMEKLPQNRPLWELHIIKYPTSGGAAGTILFKLHHALGDGFSLMAALFSCTERADDPSLPLTFPSSKTKPREVGWIKRVPHALSMCVNTVRDFGWGLLKSSLVADGRNPVRSGDDGVEFRPVIVSTVGFPLDDVRKIKAKLGGTVNDVICGIIFFGVQLYMQAASGGMSLKGDVTALVLLNTRIISSYQPLQEMTKPDAKSPWGNQFGFLHVSLPDCEDVGNVDPLLFVHKARQVINAKRRSLAVYLTGRLLEFIRTMRSPEAAAKYIHQTLRNTSMTISNLTGPMEQMIIAGHPIRSLYFMVAGVPQSLAITVVSYMGKLKMAIGTEKGFIDSELLIACMEKSFHRISEAAGSKTAY